MPEKKNKNTIGIVIGAIAAVTIIGVSAFALNKWDTPIKLSGGTKEETTSTTASDVVENEVIAGDIETEEDLWGDDIDFIEEEEEILLDGEIVFEDEPLPEPDYFLDYESDYGDFDLPEAESPVKPIQTKPSGTNNSSTSNVTSTTKKDNNDKGMFGYELDPTQSHFFTAKNAWQRNFGFCKMYDDAAPLIAFYYDTVRVFFRYGNLDWMVQLWKGQYGFIFIGSEIGVYHKEIGRDVDFYDCAWDENCLKMKMSLYRDDQLLFDRPEDYYWWSTGFVPGKLDRFADRSELKVVAKITFFDSTMTKAFLKGFEEAGFAEESVWVEPDVQPGKSYARKKFYTVSGNTVSFTWQ